MIQAFIRLATLYILFAYHTTHPQEKISYLQNTSNNNNAPTRQLNVHAYIMQDPYIIACNFLLFLKDKFYDIEWIHNGQLHAGSLAIVIPFSNIAQETPYFAFLVHHFDLDENNNAFIARQPTIINKDNIEHFSSLTPCSRSTGRLHNSDNPYTPDALGFFLLHKHRISPQCLYSCIKTVVQYQTLTFTVREKYDALY